MNDEFEVMWKEVVMTKCKVHLSGGTEIKS